MYASDLLRMSSYILTGGGNHAARLARKREFHRRLGRIERQILKEAQSDSSLFRENRCPTCGRRAADAVTFQNPVGFTFSECPTDGTVYMDPVPTEATLARLYNSDAYAFDWTEGKDTDEVSVAPKRPTELDHIRNVISLPTDRKLRLLDVGCATGTFLLTASRIFDVEGVELSAEMAAVARRNGFQVTTGRLEEVAAGERFDVITMLQVIEHVTDPALLLSQAANLLRPGGIIYVNTPAVDTASFRLFRERHSHVSSFGHVSLFTSKSWPVLSGRVGLTTLVHRHSGGHDITLHDLLTWYFMRQRFRHRMALYNSRLFYASRVIDGLSLGFLAKALSPRGHSSYQWVILQKPHIVGAGQPELHEAFV